MQQGYIEPVIGVHTSTGIEALASPALDSALATSTLPSVQNLLRSLSTSKIKPSPSYRRSDPAKSSAQELFVLPAVSAARPASGHASPAASPIGLSGEK